MRFFLLLFCVVFFSTVEVIAATPNSKATVTAISTNTAKCGKVAQTRVNGNYTNSALQSMGISSVSMSGPVAQNNDLSANPPHNGSGDGQATITQVGECHVTSDSTGKITVNTVYSDTKTTTQCNNGE